MANNDGSLAQQSGRESPSSKCRIEANKKPSCRRVAMHPLTELVASVCGGDIHAVSATRVLQRSYWPITCATSTRHNTAIQTQAPSRSRNRDQRTPGRRQACRDNHRRNETGVGVRNCHGEVDCSVRARHAPQQQSDDDEVISGLLYKVQFHSSLYDFRDFVLVAVPSTNEYLSEDSDRWICAP